MVVFLGEGECDVDKVNSREANSINVLELRLASWQVPRPEFTLDSDTTLSRYGACKDSEEVTLQTCQSSP